MKREAITAMMALVIPVIPAVASSTVVKGRLLDSFDNEGLPYATVKVYSATNTVRPLGVTVTDMDGNFSQDMARKGNYRITFEYVGKKTVSRTFTSEGEDSLDLGTQAMADDVTMMDEVSVTAMRRIVKATSDKLSYSVEDDSDSKTYTLLDMLRKVPMVSVDGEDNITVNGSQDFKVYVNGKPSMLFSTDPQKIFKSMPASSVKSIEVVTNPGARYDAEGTAGILNLVMDEKSQSDNNGYNASVGAHAGLKGYDGNVYLSGQQGKFSYSVNGIHSYMKPGESKVSSSQVYPDRIIGTQSTGDPKIKFDMASVNASYSPDSLTTIGLSGAVNGFSLDTDASSHTGISMPGTGRLPGYSSLGDMKIGRLGANGSLSFSRGFGDSRQSDISVIYQMSYEHSKNDNIWNFSGEEGSGLNLTDRTIHNPSTTLEHIVQADFTTKPRAGHTLDAGVKMSLRNAKSSSVSEFEDAAQSSYTRYDSHNNIGAAYAEYGIAAGSFSGKAGLRYEYTWQDVDFSGENGEDFSRHYGILVPSASLSYSLTPTASLGASYNMRISRPGISYLNPFVDNSDPTSVSYGNPMLDVEKTHNFGISYNLFSPRLALNTRLTDSYTGNGIERYSFYENDLLNTTYGNVAKRNNLRLDAYLNWMAAEKTRLILNGSVGHTYVKSDALSLSNKGFTWNVTAGLQQTLPWNIKGSAYLIASSKSYNLEGWNSGFRMLSVNLSKTFLDDRLSVSAGFTTGLSGHGNMKIENYRNTPQLTTNTTIRVPMTNVNVGVSYTFGTYAGKSKQREKGVSNDYIEQKSEMESLPGITVKR